MGFSKYVHMLLIELREYLGILTVSCSITLRRDSHVFQKTKNPQTLFLVKNNDRTNATYHLRYFYHLQII